MQPSIRMRLLAGAQMTLEEILEKAREVGVVHLDDRDVERFIRASHKAGLTEQVRALLTESKRCRDEGNKPGAVRYAAAACFLETRK